MGIWPQICEFHEKTVRCRKLAAPVLSAAPRAYILVCSSWGLGMREDIDMRARSLALYIIETGSTVRAAARRFGVSKSTVHMVVIN